MDEEPLSPVQREGLEQIGAKRDTWPEFSPELRGELRGEIEKGIADQVARLGPDRQICLLYTSPSPRDATLSRMPSSA